MVTDAERDQMYAWYAPEERMRANIGIRRRLAPLLDASRSEVELAYALLLSLPGSPCLYYGDEIGMGENIWLEDRDAVRTPMQWDDSPNMGFSTVVDPGALTLPLIQAPGYAHLTVATEMGRPTPCCTSPGGSCTCAAPTPSWDAGASSCAPPAMTPSWRTRAATRRRWRGQRPSCASPTSRPPPGQ